MILVSGAAGKTGRAIIRALAARGQAVRALVHRAGQSGRVITAGAGEAVVADMRDPAAIERAAAGIRAIYHICPNVSPHEVAIGQAAIVAAQALGVEQFVYHSVLHPQIEAMPHHWLKMRVEELLFESQLPYTILQPAAYMQNVLADWQAIVERGVYAVPYSATTRLSMVDLGDVAEAAAVVLTEPGHLGATYELVGPDTLTQTAVAEVLSRHLGRPVRAETIAIDVWTRQAQAAGLGEYQIDTLVKMFRYYDRHGLGGNPHVLGSLLNRAPTGFEHFIQSRTED